jgi:hypothetical protein
MTLNPRAPWGAMAIQAPKSARRRKHRGNSIPIIRKKGAHKSLSDSVLSIEKSPGNREFYGLALAIFTSANLGANWMRPRRIAYVEPRLAVFRHFLPMQPLAAVG